MADYNSILYELMTKKSVPGYFVVSQYSHTKEYKEMEKISEEIHWAIVGPKKFERNFDYYKSLNEVILNVCKLITYSKILNQKVYLSSYSDKYGNSFLQARTSLKDAFGKTKWVSAYLGSIQSFDKGDKDPIALEKGKELIREKLRAFYKL
jgi:hypothetical protein